MPVKIKSTLGSVTLAAENVSGDTTLTVPSGTDTVATTTQVNRMGGRKNLIINGDMKIAQRATSATGKTTPGYYSVDRFELVLSGLGTWTSEQSTDAPDDFSYSYKVTATTADATPASDDYAFLRQYIEGQDLQHLNYGSASAKQTTLSFWCKSNKTGTIGIETQITGSIERTADVTINSADTWEYKTVVIPGATANAIANDNAGGMSLWWWMNAGTSFKGAPNGTWGNQSTGRGGTLTAAIGSGTNDYLAITGVQFEVGDAATDFEHRSYGEELALCQRYYQYVAANGGGVRVFQGYMENSTKGRFDWAHPVVMRTAPTMTRTSGIQVYMGGSALGWSWAGWTTAEGSCMGAFEVGTTNLGTQYYGCHLRYNGTADRMELDAEL